MKLIAFDITNLTDARYYAARGACMIGFSTELSSIEEVNAIKDWVDVPEFFLRLPAQPTPDLIWEWSERTDINTFFVDEITDHSRNMFPKANWIQSYQKDALDEENSKLFLDVEQLEEWNQIHKPSCSTEIKDEVNSGYIIYNGEENFTELDFTVVSGVAIQGTEEDKVGLKAFDQIDSFLDTIDIEY